MTLEQLRIFVAVAERQHVTRAAEALHLAQSAASAAIAALEARHGTTLFHRVGRRIELTEAGTVFLVEARSVLARAEAAERTLADLGGLRRGTLSVSASQTIASYWLPRHLVAFRRAYPGVEIQLTVGNTVQVAAAVHDGAAELGFVEGVVEDEALESIEVARDRLMLVVGPEHPWAGRAGVAFADLPDSEWVLRESGSGTRSAFEIGVGRDSRGRAAARGAGPAFQRGGVRGGAGRDGGNRRLRIGRRLGPGGGPALCGRAGPPGPRLLRAAPPGAPPRQRGQGIAGADR